MDRKGEVGAHGDGWWRRAVGYQVYIRSFADGNDDGIGDFKGLVQHLPHIVNLGVDAIWLSPCSPSPMADHGYDVADYKDIEPTYGTLGDFDDFVDSAHHVGLKVIVDIVPGHTSHRHRWFLDAVSGRDDPHRAMYIFRDGKTDGSPPDNTESGFGGPAWTWSEE